MGENFERRLPKFRETTKFRKNPRERGFMFPVRKDKPVDNVEISCEIVDFFNRPLSFFMVVPLY